MRPNSTAETARLRHYLEQMMITLLMADMRASDAAEHLAEVESHCIEAGNGAPADPFELFGDPIALAQELTPPPTAGDVLRSGVITAAISFGGLGILGLALRLAGLESVSRLEAVIPIALMGVFSATALLIARPRPTEDDRSPALPVAGAAVAALTALICMALWTGFPTDEVPLHLGWLAAATLAAIVGLGWLGRSTGRHLRRHAIAPQPIGVTADILEDIATKGRWEGWIQYGVDGDRLVDMTISETVRSAFAAIRDLYRKIRVALDEPPASR